MNPEHVGEDAELYALGVLEPVDRGAVEAHIAVCVECAARVAEAESVVAALASALPAYEPAASLRRRFLPGIPTRRSFELPRWASAAAAVLVVGFGLLGWQDASLRDQRARSDAALTAIVHGHFNHATLTKARPASPGAKVLYARDGSWLYVIVDRPVAGLRLVGREASGRTRELGTAGTDGAVSTLFVRDPGPLAAVEIRDDAGLEGTAPVISSGR